MHRTAIRGIHLRQIPAELRPTFSGDVFQHVIERGGCQPVVRRLAADGFDEGGQVAFDRATGMCLAGGMKVSRLVSRAV